MVASSSRRSWLFRPLLQTDTVLSSLTVATLDEDGLENIDDFWDTFEVPEGSAPVLGLFARRITNCTATVDVCDERVFQR